MTLVGRHVVERIGVIADVICAHYFRAFARWLSVAVGMVHTLIPFVAKRWSHWHVSLGNSLRIRI